MAVKTVANTLSAGGDAFSRDDDPELIRDAAPFALKTYESLLETVPAHAGLLLTTCSSFTQYAYAFVAADASRWKPWTTTPRWHSGNGHCGYTCGAIAIASVRSN